MITGQALIGGKERSFDLTNAIDITIPFVNGGVGPNCFYAPLFEASPLVSGDFVGSTKSGSPVNFYNVRINPHGNGTHTECVGHISSEKIYIKDVCPFGLLPTILTTIYPFKVENGDRVIKRNQINEIVIPLGVNTLVIRTMPNSDDKLSRNYSGSNPPYFDVDAIKHIIDIGIEHLIVDLPSVDREEDGGEVAGHKAFWSISTSIDKNKTITEMVYIANNIKDGLYLSSINAVPFELDAAPSRILLYPIID